MRKPPQHLIEQYAGQDVEFIPRYHQIPDQGHGGLVSYQQRITWEVRQKPKPLEESSD